MGTSPGINKQGVMSKIVYICGPITGKPDGNDIQFHKAAAWYRKNGFLVCNPHEIAADFSKSTPECLIMRSELAAITVHVDFIALLPGWQFSRGSLVEIATGIISGIPFIKAFTFETLYPTLTIQADGSKTSKRLVARNNPAEENFDPIEPVQTKQGNGGLGNRTYRAPASSVPVCG